MMFAIENFFVCLLQVTLVAAFGMLFSVATRHWWRTSAALPLLVSLMAITLLTFFSFSSWPSWFSLPHSTLANRSVPPGELESQLPLKASSEELPILSVDGGNGVGISESMVQLFAWIGEVSADKVPADDRSAFSSWSAVTIAKVLLGLGLAIGLLRLLGGLISVHLFVRGSRPLRSQQLRQQVERIAAELGCRHEIEVRESSKLALAATVGFRRPVILISETWRSWSDIQLRSVLGHEIAHIRRGDFVATIIANVGLLFHFYHPLVHWLANRLRLEQELAADAMAANLVGGSRIYLDAIGELALKQSSEPMGWPAHTFLPTRRTFLRRIEMLRDLRLLSGEGTGAIRWAMTTGILAIATVAIGLRPPGPIETTSSAIAQVPAKPTAANAQQGTPLEAKYVPQAAALVAVVRPGQLYAEAEKLATAKLISSELLKPIGILKEMSQATVVYIPNNAHPTPATATHIIFDSKEVRDRFEPNLVQQNVRWEKANLLLYQFEKSVDGRFARYLPDDRSIVYGDEYVVEQMILTAGNSLSPLTQSKAWKDATNGFLVASVSAKGLSETAGGLGNSLVDMFSPLWQSASSHTLAAQLNDRLSLTLTSESADQASAKKVEATFQSGVSMLTNMLNAVKDSPDANNRKLMDSLKSILELHKIECSGNEARLKLEMGTDSLAKLMIEPLVAVKSSADRAGQTTNMMKIMLALYNYESAFGSFPPAVIVDAESGMKRSWRVELLQFLDGTGELYNQYRKNEPWDSVANKKVLAQMPDVYRHPSQPRDATTTAVTAAYGEGLVFNRSSKGIKLAEVLDGTSSTLAILESKTDIPWTKPADVEIDLKQDKLPVFGGFDSTGYTVGFMDGSVRYFGNSIDVGLLKKFFTIAGGEEVQ